MVGRLLSGAAALALLGWMLFLFLSRPTLVYEADEGGEVRAECASVVGVGWPGDHLSLLGEDGSGAYPDIIDHPDAGWSMTTRNGVHRDCDERRSTYTGTMAMLAVPASALAAFAVLSRRR